MYMYYDIKDTTSVSSVAALTLTDKYPSQFTRKLNFTF